ncbi:DUF6082 family protein [Paractinoplanes durhamensis]|uniref:DUF6082 family protein n=1 Tax=Paractinoplanes durhamensis TaxID=113563 RepID=UPI001945584F|nr:DUF6082 family protein [Actinoplanes durhamensis]
MVAIISALGGVALTPTLIGRLGPVGTPAAEAEWQRLGNVGQTYGAASAMLSVLALLGVAISLILQARESRAAREQARRALHFELLRMAMDDPFYLAVWGPFAPADTDRYREHMYANLIVSHWQMDWDVGTLDEEHLREVAAVFFQGPIGHRFWGNTRELRAKAERRHRKRWRFHTILDDEWRKAQVRAPAEPAREHSGRRLTAAVLAGAVVGAAAVRMLVRRPPGRRKR